MRLMYYVAYSPSLKTIKRKTTMRYRYIPLSILVFLSSACAGVGTDSSADMPAAPYYSLNGIWMTVIDGGHQTIVLNVTTVGQETRGGWLLIGGGAKDTM